MVVGHRAEAVTEHIAAIAPDAQTVLQAEQRGTGHAVRTALEQSTGRAGRAGPLQVPDHDLADLVLSDWNGRGGRRRDLARTPAFADQATVTRQNARSIW